MAGWIPSFCAYAQPAYIYLQRAEDKWAKGDQAGALADFNQALQKEPKHFESLLTRGKFFAKTGKKEAALADWAKALEVKPGNAEVLLERAGFYYSVNDFNAALNDLNAALKAGEAGNKAYEMRAMIRMKNNEFDKADADFEQAIKSKQITAAGLRNAAILKQKKERHDLAVNLFSEALKADAKDKESMRGMAVSLQALGGEAQARKGLEHLVAYEKAGGKPDAEFYKTRFYLNKELSQLGAMKEDLAILLDKLKVKDPALQQERAQLSLEQGDNSEALKQVNKVLASDRNNVDMLFQRAEIYYRQGKSKYAMALTDLKKIVELQASHVEAWKLMTMIQVTDQKWEKGLESAGQWIKLKPEAEAYYLRSKCQYKTNNLKACCSDLEKAASMGHAEAKKDKGVVCR